MAHQEVVQEEIEVAIEDHQEEVIASQDHNVVEEIETEGKY